MKFSTSHPLYLLRLLTTCAKIINKNKQKGHQQENTLADSISPYNFRKFMMSARNFICLNFTTRCVCVIHETWLPKPWACTVKDLTEHSSTENVWNFKNKAALFIRALKGSHESSNFLNDRSTDVRDHLTGIFHCTEEDSRIQRNEETSGVEFWSGLPCRVFPL